MKQQNGGPTKHKGGKRVGGNDFTENQEGGFAVERDVSPSIQRKIRPGQLTNEFHE